MPSKRKILIVLSILAVFFLIAVGLSERIRRHQRLISVFSQMVISTDKALLDFSEIDERYLRGEETKESYEKAWYDLNFKLEQIKKQDDKLQTPPKKLEELVSTYRAGFHLVLSVTNDAVDYLSGKTNDPMIIIKDRGKFEEGLRSLKGVKNKLQPSPKII